MKKLLCLLLVIVCGLMLWSCTMTPTTQTPCTVHTDVDGNLRCDVCGEKVDCTNHVDVNENLICDKCGDALTCNHKDENNDGRCDTKSCHYVFCEHEWDTVYTYDEDYHWVENSCDCDIAPANKAEHIDENNDGLCDTCKWNYDHTHTYKTEWSHDQVNHWRDPSCGHNVIGEKAAHSDANNDSVCDGCGWDYDHTHEFSKDWTHDETDHWHEATCNHSVVSDKAAHADENNDSICDGCGWDYDHTHEYNTEMWSSDKNGHWHAPSCGHSVDGIDFAAHEDSDNDGHCDTCDYIVCENHTFDETRWEYNETTHWHPSKCGHSDATMEAAGHSFDENYYCSMCGFQHEHKYSEEYSFDGEYHWHDTICEEVIHGVLTDEKIPHTDEEGNDGFCEVCQKQFCQHEYDEEWTIDETSHWHEPLCDHDVDVSGKGDHVDENNDGVCEVCEKQFCQHYGGEIKFDADYHWYEKFCQHDVPETSTKISHYLSDVEADNDGICNECNYQYCNHEYDTESWTSDETGHWHAPTCGHNVDGIDFDAHVDGENNDGVCDTCQYQMCEHTWDTENWTSDGSGHWHAVTCGHNVDVKDFAEHVDTADNNGVCDICQFQTCYHTWDTENWTSDETGHWHAVSCGHDVDVIDFAGHVDTEDNNGICDICQFQTCYHTWDTENWTTDGTAHWHAVTCGHDVDVKDYATHEATDKAEGANNDGICEACQYQYCQHTYADTWSFDENNHWKTVTCGHDVGVTEEHLDEDNNGVCETCLHQFCDHYNTKDWAYDGQYHYHEKTCEHDVEDAIDKVQHTDNDGNLKCDECEHYYEDPDAETPDIDEDDAITTNPHLITTP